MPLQIEHTDQQEHTTQQIQLLEQYQNLFQHYLKEIASKSEEERVSCINKNADQILHKINSIYFTSARKAIAYYRINYFHEEYPGSQRFVLSNAVINLTPDEKTMFIKDMAYEINHGLCVTIPTTPQNVAKSYPKIKTEQVSELSEILALVLSSSVTKTEFITATSSTEFPLIKQILIDQHKLSDKSKTYLHDLKQFIQ